MQEENYQKTALLVNILTLGIIPIVKLIIEAVQRRKATRSHRRSTKSKGTHNENQEP